MKTTSARCAIPHTKAGRRALFEKNWKTLRQQSSRVTRSEARECLRRQSAIVGEMARDAFAKLRDQFTSRPNAAEIEHYLDAELKALLSILRKGEV